MRATALALTMMVLGVTPGFSQTPATSQHPYGLDPYKPSDAFFLRNYGAALVAQTPLLELAKLDPYKPSEAALLRQIGGAIPVWSVVWETALSGFGPLAPFRVPAFSAVRQPSDADRPARSMEASLAGWPSVGAPSLAAVPRQPAPSDTPSVTGDRACWIRMGDRTVTCVERRE